MAKIIRIKTVLYFDLIWYDLCIELYIYFFFYELMYVCIYILYLLIGININVNRLEFLNILYYYINKLWKF